VDNKGRRKKKRREGKIRNKKQKEAENETKIKSNTGAEKELGKWDINGGKRLASGDLEDASSNARRMLPLNQFSCTALRSTKLPNITAWSH
jgi:hypothetical protein